MAREVVDTDAPEIRQWLRDFLGDDANLPTEDRIKQGINSTEFILAIEPGVGYAELKMTPRIQVRTILPRGTDIPLLSPSLDRVFTNALIVRRPETEVWARFFGGLDADGVPDGGESECKAWHIPYPNTIVVPPVERGGLWEIRSTRGLGGLV